VDSLRGGLGFPGVCPLASGSIGRAPMILEAASLGDSVASLALELWLAARVRLRDTRLLSLSVLICW